MCYSILVLWLYTYRRASQLHQRLQLLYTQHYTCICLRRKDGPYLPAAFAASHKICIRYLKGENANVQLMYLGGISMIGSVLLAMDNALDCLLLLLTGTCSLLSGICCCTHSSCCNCNCHFKYGYFHAGAWHSHSHGISVQNADALCLYCAGCTAYGFQMSQTIALKMSEACLATAMSYFPVV